MTINELGSLGEFIGSIGIVVTLIYLAIEIRQNRHSMDESRKMALADALLRRNDLLERSVMQSALSESMVEIVLRARNEGLQSLSKVDVGRLRLYETARAIRMEAQYYQWKYGLLDDGSLELAVNILRNGVWKLWQELGAAHGTREFREAMRKALDETGSAGVRPSDGSEARQ